MFSSQSSGRGEEPAAEQSVAIDQQSYPHIIDTIWSFMPYPSLVACMRVSKTWQTRARDQLFDHVVLMERKNKTTVVLSRNLDWPEITAVLVLSQDGGIEPFRPMFQKSSIVDLPPPPTSRTPTDATPGGFKRFLNFGGHWTGTKIELNELHCADVVCFMRYSNGHCLSPIGSVKWTNSLVLSIDCADSPMTDLRSVPQAKKYKSWNIVDHLRFVERFALILKDGVGTTCKDPGPAGSAPQQAVDTTGDVGNHWEWEPLADGTCVPQLGVVCELLLNLLLMPDIVVVEVVGAEAFVPKEEMAAYAAKVRRVIVKIAERDQDTAVPAPMGHLGRKIQFLTHEEYRARVGEDRYRLETEI